MQQEDVAVPGWKIRQISRHSSFHGAISQDTAEYKLKKRKSNTFLTRYSESSDQYTLSVRRKTEDKWVVKHYEIVITNENKETVFEIVGTGEKFHDITELLKFYKKNALDNHITAIGEAVVKEVEEEVLSEEGDSEAIRMSIPCAEEEEDVVLDLGENETIRTSIPCTKEEKEEVPLVPKGMLMLESTPATATPQQ
jgi:hypothetical protein